MAVCAAVSLAAAGAAQDRRPATFGDVMSLRAVGSPAVSPDGRAVLYTVREWVDARRDGGPDWPARKQSRTQVWRVSAAGDPRPRQMTFGNRGASAPAWSPDGRFMSVVAARGEGTGEDEPRPQIWIMPADGGEAWALTDAAEGVGAYAWSPDARRIAYLTQDPLEAEALVDLLGSGFLFLALPVFLGLLLHHLAQLFLGLVLLERVEQALRLLLAHLARFQRLRGLRLFFILVLLARVLFLLLLFLQHN